MEKVTDKKIPNGEHPREGALPKKVYAVGNAHLDPVWQWNWQEGSAEAKTTVRAALDRMREYPDFRFVCSSASVYRWVEEFSPELFEEMKERIAEGRFVIVGGWHVQPDCNLPSGEGYARQALYAQRYFADRFGRAARIGYNVDSFGHNGNMPQILRQSGLDRYIFMRPGPHEKTLPENVFVWEGIDGSQVLTCRILDPYCFKFEQREELEERLRYLYENVPEAMQSVHLFYGVGNHGGGPTIRHIEVLHEYAKAHPESEVIYSDLTDFFDEIEKEMNREKGTSPVKLKGEMQHHASGCYSTVGKLKEQVRKTEYALADAEAYAMLASTLLRPMDCRAEMEQAWLKVNFLHFHDAMGGCCMESVFRGTDRMAGYAAQIADEVQNRALQSVGFGLDTTDRSFGLPVVVFNPNSFPVDAQVYLNLDCAGIRNAEGEFVPVQKIRSETVSCMNRPDVLFRAQVPALGYAVYYRSEEEGPAAESRICVSAHKGAQAAGSPARTVMENEFYRLTIEDRSGQILSLFDKETGRECLSAPGCVGLVLDETEHDTWSHGKNTFDRVIGQFSDGHAIVLEEGPLRGRVKTFTRYGASTLVVEYTLKAGEKAVYLKYDVDWHEKHKMLKMAWPFVLENAQAYSQIPFGTIRRPCNGEEESGQGFVALIDRTGHGFAMLNDRTYSSSCLGSTLYHTLLRSPIYGDHGGPRFEDSRYTEQGESRFEAVLMPVEGRLAPVVRAAKRLHSPLTCVPETYHEGALKEKVKEGISISSDHVLLSACKRGEDGRSVVVRVYEIEGQSAKFELKGPVVPTPLRASLHPFEVATFRLPDGGKKWRRVLFTEWTGAQMKQYQETEK